MKWLHALSIAAALYCAGCVSEYPVPPRTEPAGAESFEECKAEWARQDELMDGIEAAVADLADVLQTDAKETANAAH